MSERGHLSPHSSLRRDLTRIAFEVGSILNLVQDDDERDELHGLFERTVNDQLYAGSLNRAEAKPILLALRAVAPVIDIFSKRADRLPGGIA